MEVKQSKKSKKIGLLIFIGFILIVIGIVIYVVINYTTDQAEIKKRMDSIKISYQNFKEETDNFNAKRDTIYSEVMQDMYYQTLKDNDNHYKELFNLYNETIIGIDNIYNSVKNKCINSLYPDVNVNNKCEAIIIGYEKLVNTYVSDVKIYNSNIEKYNEFIKTANDDSSSLEKIKLDHKFIDINGDRKYEGKKEIKDTISDNTADTKEDESAKFPSE